jgi:ribosomal protein L29
MLEFRESKELAMQEEIKQLKAKLAGYKGKRAAAGTTANNESINAAELLAMRDKLEALKSAYGTKV